jgi:hypothetical protein
MNASVHAKLHKIESFDGHSIGMENTLSFEMNELQLEVRNDFGGNQPEF